MKFISQHLGEILIALAGVVLIITLVVFFSAPIENFFVDMMKDMGLGNSTSGYNHEAPELHPSGTIPERGEYTHYVNGVYDTEKWEWSYDDEIMYEPGDAFITPVVGDIYTYEDYEYCYGWYWCLDCETWSHKCGCEFAINGWAARVLDNSKSAYGEILESINNEPVTTLFYTFGGCTALREAPVIPKDVTNMTVAFEGCVSLTEAPEIPENVTNMRYAFQNCVALTKAPVIPMGVTDLFGTFWSCGELAGPITIHADPETYDYCLTNTQVTEILGYCKIKDEILATK